MGAVWFGSMRPLCVMAWDQGKLVEWDLYGLGAWDLFGLGVWDSYMLHRGSCVYCMMVAVWSGSVGPGYIVGWYCVGK
jgi:hypothetical protein